MRQRLAATRVLISPEMVDMLKRLEKDGSLSPRWISRMPYASKTAKSLEKYRLVERDKDYNFVLTDRGRALLNLEPRWSGTKEDQWGRQIKVWSVVDYGTYFSNFSEDHPREDLWVNLTPDLERSTVFASGNHKAKLLQKKGSGKTAGWQTVKMLPDGSSVEYNVGEGYYLAKKDQDIADWEFLCSEDEGSECAVEKATKQHMSSTHKTAAYMFTLTITPDVEICKTYWTDHGEGWFPGMKPRVWDSVSMAEAWGKIKHLHKCSSKIEMIPHNADRSTK